jgi:hypothetical protein
MTEYNALVAFDGELPRSVIGYVLDELGTFGAVVSARRDGGTEVVVTVDERSLREASDRALARVQQAVGRPPRSVEVLPTTDFDARSKLGAEE